MFLRFAHQKSPSGDLGVKNRGKKQSNQTIFPRFAHQSPPAGGQESFRETKFGEANLGVKQNRGLFDSATC